MYPADWVEYQSCVEELLSSPQVAQLKGIRHHPGVSCYEHSAFVSYVAWRLARRWGADGTMAARAGLLHDLYLYGPRSLPSWRQCFAHPAAGRCWPPARKPVSDRLTFVFCAVGRTGIL